jgi:hypothetical protein
VNTRTQDATGSHARPALLEEVSRAPASPPLWKFPVSYGHEDDQTYYLDCLGSMRAWVSELMADVRSDPPPERYCLAFVEHHAIRELQRPLRSPERELLYRATRDVVNVWLALESAGRR